MQVYRNRNYNFFSVTKIKNSTETAGIPDRTETEYLLKTRQVRTSIKVTHSFLSASLASVLLPRIFPFVLVCHSR